MEFRVTTPEKVLNEGKCDSLSVPGVSGQWGILPGHTRYFSLLRKGVITIFEEGREMDFPCEKGFVKVDGDHIDIILTS